VERAFERLAEQGRALAKRLGKGELDISIEGNGVRLDPDTWTPFFSVLTHVVRNSIDHGIEPTGEREAVGKAAFGRLSFSARAGDNSLTLELADDGRGIDWDAIAAKAKEAGMPYRSHADLFNALLSDGISTKQECTDVSGRGVGLSAVRQRIDGMQGKLEVQSVRGKGTRWVIRFPWSPNAIPTVKLRRSTFPSRRISLQPASRGRVAS
jgi:two-component system chemotaxis sensor kinase CheA